MMTNPTYKKRRSSEWMADMAVWARQNQEDNSEQLARMKRNLKKARQQEMVRLYYDEGLNMPQIAERLGLHRSTVSRTLRRAKDRLYRCLRYSL